MVDLDPCKKGLICNLLGCFIILTSRPLCQSQSHPKPSRAESEKAIRKIGLRNDEGVPHPGRRNLQTSLGEANTGPRRPCLRSARQDPRYQQELQKARITNADQFLGYFLQGMANQYLQAMPLISRSRGTEESPTTQPLRSSAIPRPDRRRGDSGFARARLVAQAWKIDLTDWLKKAVLKEIKDPELRAKIKSL